MIEPPIIAASADGHHARKDLDLLHVIGSGLESGGFIWLAQAEVGCTPPTMIFSRSSAMPWIAGRRETPPASLMLTPGVFSKSLRRVGDRRPFFLDLFLVDDLSVTIGCRRHWGRGG